VTGAKEWYAVVFTARQAQAPESKKAAALLCVTVTASNEGKSERKGSHEASLCECLPVSYNGAQGQATHMQLLSFFSRTAKAKGARKQ
jgi:hypothetical protein